MSPLIDERMATVETKQQLQYDYIQEQLKDIGEQLTRGFSTIESKLQAITNTVECHSQAIAELQRESKNRKARWRVLQGLAIAALGWIGSTVGNQLLRLLGGF